MHYNYILIIASLLPLLCYNLQFSAPPTDLIARLGSTVAFSCLIEQTPDLTQPFTVEWLFNGNILDIVPHSGAVRRVSSLDMSFLTSTLSLTDIIWSDSGQYSCQLSITNGTSTTSDSASLEIATLADTFLTSPESKSPMVGEDSVYLFCSHGNSHPPANISWLKNSQLDSSLTFTTTTLIVGGVPVSSSTLTISQAKSTDIGAYTCLATSDYFPDLEILSATALIMVGSETSSPVWLQHPYAEEVIANTIGAEVELTCVVFGNPTPSVTWTRDGSDLAISTEITLNTGIQSSYTIAALSESDLGSYRCRALNILATTLSNAVELRLAFLEDNFSQEPDDTIVFEGQEAFLRCTPPSSLPPAVIAWTYEDVSIEGDGYEVTIGGDLVIVVTSLLDTGEYRCVSTNPLTNAQNSFYGDRNTHLVRLIVINVRNVILHLNTEFTDNRSINTPLYWDNRLEVLRLSQSARLLVATPIELNISQELVQTLVNSEVVISCSAIGVPAPSIAWTRDNILLPSSLYPQIIINGNQLIISNVLLSHEGYFNCTAINQVETQIAQVFVDVIQPPIVTAVSTALTTREGHQSVLICSVEGDPLPLLEWKKMQDTTIDLSNIHSVYSNGTLVISNTDRTDAGDYICRGMNVGGEDQDTISLNVHFPPLITSQFSDQLVAPGDSVSLLCTAEGNPAPQVSWAGPDGPIPSSTPDLLSLTNVQPDAEGEYTCVATNSVQTVSSKVSIIVTALPEVTIIGGVQLVIEGQSTSIQCRILSGNPVPQVSWYRDDQVLTNSLPSISISISNLISTLSLSPAIRDDTNNYTCRGVNAAGSSESTVLINVLSPPAPPQIISLLPLVSTPPSPDTTSLFLNWTMEEDGGSPVLSYVIRYTALLATPSLTQEEVVEADPRELVIDQLVPYTTYEVQIYARNLIGVSTFSLASIIRSLILHPSVPRDILLSSPGPYSLTCSWGYPIPANGPLAFYEIQYQLFSTSQTNKIEFLEVSAEILSVNLTSLMPQSAYSVSIRAKNRDEQGNLLIGPFSQALLGDTGFQAPSNPPTILSVTATSSQSIGIVWIPADVDIAAPVTSYVISIVSVSQTIPPAPAPIQISALSNSTEVTGLFPYSQYLVSIASSNSKGISAYGAESSVTTEEDIPISPAVILTLFSQESTVIEMSWDDPPFTQVRGEIVRYDVHYKRTDEDREFDIIRSNTKSAMITGLDAFTEYHVGVAIVTGKGAGPRNEPALVQRTAEGVPTTPTSLAAEVGDDSARLGWGQPVSKNGLLQEYTVRLEDVLTGEVLMLTLPTHNSITEPYILIEGLVPGSEYSFRVTASTGAGPGDVSEAGTFNTTGTRPTAPPPLTVTVIVTVPVTVTTVSTQATSPTTQVTESTTQDTSTSTQSSTTQTVTDPTPATNSTTPSSTPQTTQNNTSSQTNPTTPIITTPATTAAATTQAPGVVFLTNYASIVISAVIIAILLILLVLVLIFVGVYFIRNQGERAKARGLKIRGLTDMGRSRSNSVASSRRPQSLTLANPYHAISKGAVSPINPQSERSWYTSVRSPPKADTMDTLQDLIAEKEGQRGAAGNLFTPYGYRPPALGGEPTPSPAGMRQEVISKSYSHEGVNVDRERKQLSSPKPTHNGVFILDKVLTTKRSRDVRGDISPVGSEPPSLPPRRYQEEPILRFVTDDGEFDDLDGEPERDEGFNM